MTEIIPGSPERLKSCECGCGLPAPIASRTRASKGHVKGQPLRFRQGHGANQAPPAPRIPFINRFEQYVKRGAPNECWLWTGAGGEYGHVKVNNRQVGAHVATYEAFHGPVPRGMVVRHNCDTPRCCNPNHLVLGTYLDNSRDAIDRDRTARGERCGQATITEAQVSEIRRLRTHGARICDIVRQLDVPRDRKSVV